MDAADSRWRSVASFGLFRDTEMPPPKDRNLKFRIACAVVATVLLLLMVVFFVVRTSRSKEPTPSKAKRFVTFDGDEKSEFHPNHRYRPIDPDEIVRNDAMDRKLEQRRRLQKISNELQENELGRPIRFRGIYRNREKKEDEGEDYFRQINNLLQPKEDSIRQIRRHVYFDRASPFRQRDYDEDSKNELLRRKNRKPITLMLDIYPMVRSENRDEEDVRPMPKPRKYPPLDHNAVYTLVPLKSRKIGAKPGRVIMKVNLYPKHGREEKMREIRRNFGWMPRKRNGGVPFGRSRPGDGRWFDADNLPYRYRVK